MTVTQPQAIIYIDNDPRDHPLPLEIPVIIDYLVTIDSSYGEDADGNRGELRVEYEILDAFIEADVLKCLTPELATWAIENARHIFMKSKKHF